jgi:hypothetical protein
MGYPTPTGDPAMDRALESFHEQRQNHLRTVRAGFLNYLVKTPREWLAHKAVRRKVVAEGVFGWDD